MYGDNEPLCKTLENNNDNKKSNNNPFFAIFRPCHNRSYYMIPPLLPKSIFFKSRLALTLLYSYQSSSSSFPCLPLIALCRALKASASPPARLPPPILFGVARPESVPLPVPRLIPLSLAGDAAGFRAAGTGLLAGGAGGVGFAFAPTGGAEGRVWPLATTGVGTARGGAAGGGGGGGGAARTCSISST